MKISYSRQFVKHFEQRVKNNISLNQKVSERIQLFIKSPNDPILRDHQLTGRKKNFRAFSITGDIRIVYTVIDVVDNEVLFYDIGSHNQVY